MAYWLLKADPEVYGWAHLEKDRRTFWDGVTNNLALKHMRSVEKGDQAFLYHSGKEKAVVGIVAITSMPYADPQQKDPRLVVFDLEPRRRLRQPVTLATLKSDARFADFALVRMPRLSVMPVPAALWKRILSLAGDKA